MIDKTPQVFISYSWTSDEYQQKVIELAERLMHDGVLVKLDVWDLKDGHDKYAYMEKCVNDPDIDRVLILSDRRYAEKADARKGGVGDETTIISPEIYGHAEQEIFLPVVMERDENGDLCLPAYLKSRLCIDLSRDYSFEAEYEKLVRDIYDKPLHRKPELGTPPTWLNDEPDSLFPVKESGNRVRNAALGSMKDAESHAFIDTYIEQLKQFHKKGYADPQDYLDDFSAMKDYRDLFLDFVRDNSSRPDYGAFLPDIFEKLYNNLCYAKTYDTRASSCGDTVFDIFKLHIWELFICTIAFLMHNELYSTINSMLYHTYFLRRNGLSEELLPKSYADFQHYSLLLEEQFKSKMPGDLERKHTLAGHYIVTEREYLPVYSGKKIANADLLLYQVYNALELDDFRRDYWFPALYVYADTNASIWGKMKSRRFCAKIMPLFGVNQSPKAMEELRLRISACIHSDSMRYNKAFEAAPAILDAISPEEIGTLP